MWIRLAHKWLLMLMLSVSVVAGDVAEHRGPRDLTHYHSYPDHITQPSGEDGSLRNIINIRIKINSADRPEQLRSDNSVNSTRNRDYDATSHISKEMDDDNHWGSDDDGSLGELDDDTLTSVVRDGQLALGSAKADSQLMLESTTADSPLRPNQRRLARAAAENRPSFGDPTLHLSSKPIEGEQRLMRHGCVLF